MIKHRARCHLCHSSDVELVLPLRPTPIADAYVSADQLAPEQLCLPLDVYLCRACGHVQLLDVVDPSVLYGDYLYVTASSPGLVKHFEGYADDVMARLGSPTGLAVDIGSNDGTLLRFLQSRGLRVLGVDAAPEIARAATESGVPTVNAFFGSALAAELRAAHGPAVLVTANNVFAHSDALADMAAGVRALLAPDGLFVFEVSYLLDTVENMVFDYIYHEHLSYHSVRPLVSFLAGHGLQLIDVQTVATKGGSLRCFAQPAGGPRPLEPTVAEYVEREDRVGAHTPAWFEAFGQRIEAARRELMEELRPLAERGETLVGYGASATVTTLLYHFELAPYLKFLVDDNPTRHGLYTPGHHLPVLPSSALYEQQVDCVVILAWRFAAAIRKQHQAFPGRFIVPLPRLETFPPQHEGQRGA